MELLIFTLAVQLKAIGTRLFYHPVLTYEMSLRGVLIDWLSVCFIICEQNEESANERDTDVINIQCQCRV